jgi:predicted nucleic acid-binding protein
MFLTLAAAGKAEVLVTGDKALLGLTGRTGFAIETPALFKTRFS